MADCAELDLDLDQELDQDLDRKPLDLEGPLKRDDSAGHCNDKLPSGDLDLILPVNPSRVTCTNPESTNTAKTNPVVAGSGSRLYNAAGQNSYIQSHDIDRFKYCTETELSSETPACSETPIEIIKSSSVLFEVEATSEALNVTTELAENREPCADAHYQEGSGTCESNNLQALPSSPPTSDSLSYSPNERVSVNKSMKVTVAFEVDFSSNTNTNEFREMPKKAKTSLQEAFLHFRKKRQVLAILCDVLFARLCSGRTGFQQGLAPLDGFSSS
ncbi:hypothetical protein RRG08_007640 [Elysia crispata]|uniref:Uncharacterized protein n=1 Tax=Elysia crispata TaxID=231223 RepID=A0AAE1CRS7_9GAST|nr:hypothetical protein RRG08_007640 [Elysia crispata]